MINLFAKMNSNFEKEALRMRSTRRMRLPSYSDYEQEEGGGEEALFVQDI